MLHLDTHAVVWLYAGAVELFPAAARRLLEEHDLGVSPAVVLELQYLREIKRITATPDAVMHSLAALMSLHVLDLSFSAVVHAAMTNTWTRDPFDRLIVATAACDNACLLTKDAAILRHYPKACWSRSPQM